MQKSCLLAGLMALSRTAPRRRGRTLSASKYLKVKNLIVWLMLWFSGERTGKKNWDRDGDNVRQSSAVLLISLDKPQPAGLNCALVDLRLVLSCPSREKDRVCWTAVRLALDGFRYCLRLGG